MSGTKIERRPGTQERGGGALLGFETSGRRGEVPGGGGAMRFYEGEGRGRRPEQRWRGRGKLLGGGACSLGGAKTGRASSCGGDTRPWTAARPGRGAPGEVGQQARGEGRPWRRRGSERDEVGGSMREGDRVRECMVGLHEGEASRVGAGRAGAWLVSGDLRGGVHACTQSG